MKEYYEYTENKKVKFYRSSIDGQIRFPYTFSKRKLLDKQNVRVIQAEN